MPGWYGSRAAERNYPRSEVRGGGREKLPLPEARGGGREELHHTQDHGRQLRGAILHPRSGGCTGTAKPRGANP